MGPCGALSALKVFVPKASIGKRIRGRFFDPHPRSAEAIGSLAAYRGGQARCNYAEAFEAVMRRI
jgi:hypothetical protein